MISSISLISLIYLIYFLDFIDLFNLFHGFHGFPRARGGRSRTCDLVVESRRPRARPLSYTRHPLQVVPKIPSGTKKWGGIHLGPTSKTKNLGFWVFDVGPRSEIGHPYWIRSLQRPMGPHRALALRAKILGAKYKWRFLFCNQGPVD